VDELSVSHPNVGDVERTAPTPVLRAAREHPVFEWRDMGLSCGSASPGVHRRAREFIHEELTQELSLISSGAADWTYDL